MKTLICLILACGFLIGCNSSRISTLKSNQKVDPSFSNDTVRIANDELFNFWLASIAKPEGYYSQSFLENRNLFYVIEWNNRVLQPQRFDPNLYELQIDYQQGIDYGYEVNYKLYNYFVYFQLKYKQRLGAFPPRI